MSDRLVYDQLTLTNFSENKKVIPIYYKNGEFWHTDIKLPDLLLTNESQSALEVENVVIIGFAQDKEMVKLYVDKEIIVESTRSIHQILKKQRNSSSIWSSYNLGMLFGKLPSLPHSFEDLPLPSNSAACLRLQDLFWFHFAGTMKIDHVCCEVITTFGGKRQSIIQEISLTPYTCKGDYIFPLKGQVTITGMPVNRVLGHRIATSQEFAFDVVDFRPKMTDGFSPSDPPDSSHVRDYFLFERGVLAIGDGVVVASGNRWPNSWVENPLINPDDRIIEKTQNLLDCGVDFVHAILGNFVILDHQNGEFSVYAHMSENSVTVQPGDPVSQGQVIGQVGNTSNSDFPHLHFHLMDSPDFITANGLPVRFVNIPDGQPALWDFSKANTLIYSDYIFLNIPA
jgi:hypothetical protein